MRLRQLAWLCLAVGFSGPAVAHSPLSGSVEERWAAGLSAALIALLWVVYLRGVWRLRQTGGRVRAGAILLVHTSLALTVLAVLGPLDHWAETSATAHMVQHMMFMVVIPPLLVLARPLPSLHAGLGPVARPLLTPMIRFTAHPMLTAYLHGIMLWAWHVPAYYRLALEDPWWHAVEHACFLVSAGLFWWAVLAAGVRRAHWALFALLFTLMHTGFLGAMLTFARAPLYGDSRHLADQQLAGLIMWVPGAVPYLLASAWVGYLWFRRLQRRHTRPRQ